MKWISVDSTLESQRGIPVWSRNPTLHKPEHKYVYFSKHMSAMWSTSPSLSRSRCEGRPDGSGWWTSRLHAEGVAAGGSMPVILAHLSQVPSPQYSFNLRI